MGYTHYWERPAKLDKKTWGQYIEELQMLKENLPEHCITAGNNYKDEHIEIAGWNHAKEEYEIDYDIYDPETESIAFNGVGDLSHESFNLERVLDKEGYSQPNPKTGLAFGFCKTAHKPYDTFVCLALISFKRWFLNKVTVSSDGDKSDWENALVLYHKLTDAHIPTYNMLMKGDD